MTVNLDEGFGLVGVSRVKGQGLDFQCCRLQKYVIWVLLLRSWALARVPYEFSRDVAGAFQSRSWNRDSCRKEVRFFVATGVSA